MEQFLDAAKLAWNPVGEIRNRHNAGTLSFLSVLVPYIGIVIACNLFAIGAEKFFFECVFSQVGAEMPDSPLLKNDWAQKFMSALGVLVPIGAVALLPAGVFRPSNRNELSAALLVVSGAWAFYGALLGAPVYFVSGVVALGDVQAGLVTLATLGAVLGVVLTVLLTVFWFRISLSIFRVGVGRTLLITLVSLAAIAGLVATMVWIMRGVLESSN